MKEPGRRNPAFNRWLVSLGVCLVISNLSYFPHYIAYMNELVIDRKMAYKILSDSNLDWNQGQWFLSDYLKRHPEAIYEPEKPTTGRIVVGATALTGVLGPLKPSFDWLRENFEPVDHIAYSYLIFDISKDDLERLSNPSPSHIPLIKI